MIYDGPFEEPPTAEQRAAGERWYQSVSTGGDLMHHVAQRLGISSVQVSQFRHGHVPVPDHLKEPKS